MLNSSDILYWLAALRMPEIGPVTIRRGIHAFHGIKNFFAATARDLLAAGLKEKQIHHLQNPDWKSAERDLLFCKDQHCFILTLEDPLYPPQLLQISDAPVVLFVKGDISALKNPQIAIVGSRNPTIMGRQNAEHFGFALAKEQIITTSGLALGIDGAAHRGALKGQGQTIAVLGTGLGYIYPASHRPLAEKIIEQGALISEFPPDEKPKRNNFPRRNRIISGLSLGVLVIEAALKSGSLITARFSVEQGREVFAIPGSIHNPLAKGCHQLLQQGAKLVENIKDILEECRIIPYSARSIEPDTMDAKARSLLDLIGYEVVGLDVIMRHFGLTASEVSSILLYLELQGYIQNVRGGFIRTINDATFK